MMRFRTDENNNTDAPDINVDGILYKQAVIDEIQKCTEVYINNLPPMIDKAEVQTKIMLMPSAQPEIVRCKYCKHNASSHKCLHPDSFFLVPADDFYCGYAERRTDETD